MDKKEGFAERRARQKEKLMAQRAEKRIATSTAMDNAAPQPNSDSPVSRADSPGSAEGFVHVDRADASDMDSAASSLAQEATEQAVVHSPVGLKPGKSNTSFLAESKARQPASSSPAAVPTSKAAEDTQKLQITLPAVPAPMQPHAALSLSATAEHAHASGSQAAAAAQLEEHPATQGVQHSRAELRKAYVKQGQQEAGKIALPETSQEAGHSQTPVQQKLENAEQIPPLPKFIQQISGGSQPSGTGESQQSQTAPSGSQTRASLGSAIKQASKSFM